MRPSLIALIPRDDLQGSCAAAIVHFERLRFVQLSIGNAQLFVADPHSVVPFLRPEGALVGTVFDRADNRPITTLAPNRCLAVEGSDGRALTTSLWGSYAALWCDRRSGALCIYRDSSGALPLFHCRTTACDIVFTDLCLAVESGLLQPQIDWGGIAHGLRYRQLPTERTGLEGVSEILPGQRITLDETTPPREHLWSPWTFTPRADVWEPRGADELAECVTTTISAWGSRYGSVQLELSGGLDSSIIAYSLAHRLDPWRCATLYTPGADGDERSYARRMAAAASVALAEIAVSATDFGSLDLPKRLRVRPGGFGVLDAIDRASVSAATEFGADVIFSGTGGDNVFCYILSATPVFDAFRLRGLAQARSTVSDIAKLSGTTDWSIVRHVLERFVRDKVRPQQWPSTSEFLGLAECPVIALHPWLTMPEGGLRGSRTQIASLLRILPMIDAFDRAVNPGLLFPLLSQPVVEACLAIPSWQWTQGGRDRAAVRGAFEGRLPPEITARRSKGRLESAVLPAFERARSAIAEIVSRGHLAAHGIIDGDAVDRALGSGAGADELGYTRILELLDVELWVSSIVGCGYAGSPLG